MTKKEAIELLEDLYGAIEDNHGRDYDEAFRMAIEALLIDAPKGDLISRQWLLDLYATPKDGKGIDWKVPLEVVQQNIKDAPSVEVEAKDDWIPCSKGLPDIGEDVLTTDIYGDVDIEILTEVPRSDDVIWEDDGGFYTDFEDIIAWMPKPKPYKSGGE